MVSVNTNPAQGFYLYDPAMSMSMGLPGLNYLPPQQIPSSTPPGAVITSHVNTTAYQEDVSKKIRKPYTITKSRENWTEQEHDKFLEALQLFDRDWKKIEAFVGSKTVIQIRSHAQKYFMKVQKNGTSEHVPPPRPKRKAAHPYPQKASKYAAPFATQVTGQFLSSSAAHDPRYVYQPDSSSVLGGDLTSWTCNAVAQVNMPPVTEDDEGLAGHAGALNYSSSNDSSQRTWNTSEIIDQGNHGEPTTVKPDFSLVYSFIGSIFDPNASGHLQRLKQMDPINMETVMQLMTNLSINLTSPMFEDQKRLLASQDIDSQEATFGDP